MKKLLVGLTLLASMSVLANSKSDRIVNINLEVLKDSEVCVYSAPDSGEESVVYCGETEALRLVSPGTSFLARQALRKIDLIRAVLMDVMYQNDFKMLISPDFAGDISSMNTITFVKED